MSEAGWARPDAPPEPAAPGNADRAAPPPPVGQPVPHLRVFERPLTPGDVVDDAFEILKARPWVFVGLTLVLVAPLRVLTVWLTRDVVGGPSIPAALADPDAYRDEAWQEGWVLGTMLGSAGLALLGAAVALVVGGWADGRDLSARAALGALGRGWVRVPVAWALSHLVVLPMWFTAIEPDLAVLGLLLLLVFVFWVVVAPVIAIENRSAPAALARSWRLVGRRYWATVWIVILVAGVSVTLEQSLPLVTVALGGQAGDLGWTLVGLGALAASLVTAPFVAAAATLLYLDLRVRVEGFDIERTMGAGGVHAR